MVQQELNLGYHRVTLENCGKLHPRNVAAVSYNETFVRGITGLEFDNLSPIKCSVLKENGQPKLLPTMLSYHRDSYFRAVALLQDTETERPVPGCHHQA